MSVITRLLERIHGKPDYRLLFLGLDSSGRTTALYKLKLNEVVTTIPTIGFNVETIEHNGGRLTVWDVGGCDKIRPLWRHYFQGTDAVVFFVDSNDRDRIDEAREELGRLMREDELQACILLVLANKQDLPNAISVLEVTDKMELDRFRAKARNIVGTCAKTGDGLSEAMDWLVDQLRGNGGKSSTGNGSARTHTPAVSTEETLEAAEARKQEELLIEWLEREDEDDDEFLAKLNSYSLDSWDHRTHLRIAWLLLKRHGRREGLRLIFDGIKRFIENSDRTKRSRGTTFHETMTYFWVHMVHYAMETTANPSGDFKGFLLMNPQLSNGGLFLHYYTKKLMLLSPEARTQVVMPDKIPLPSLISSTEPAADLAPIEERFSPSKPMSDDEFIDRFRNATLPSWGHEVKLRVIWKLLKDGAGERRSTNNTLDALKAAEGVGHHVTVTYFWLQMISYCVAKTGDAETWAAFVQRPECQQLLNPDLIDKHYSNRILTTGVEMFQLPDRKPLPNGVR
eukprot:TRINITY_DN14087_c0_g1_i1.p1 TRINITY_DN14087_c0_g1~~TRINITY_DN14087_c0_g1_i1.p1  ORF type:complete len:511 (+),score=89.43 TRINITY_DN14087_c0_g1_i1:78-1610(+)